MVTATPRLDLRAQESKSSSEDSRSIRPLNVKRVLELPHFFLRSGVSNKPCLLGAGGEGEGPTEKPRHKMERTTQRGLLHRPNIDTAHSKNQL